MHIILPAADYTRVHTSQERLVEACSRKAVARRVKWEFRHQVVLGWKKRFSFAPVNNVMFVSLFMVSFNM